MFELGFLRFAKRRAQFLLENLRGIYEVSKRSPGIEIRHGVTLIHPELLECGEGLRVAAGCFIHCGGNAWSGGKGKLRFGKGCWVEQNAVLYAAGGIEIGDYVGIGPGSCVFSSRDDYSMEHAYKDHIVHLFGKVAIGSYTRIFAGVVISPGVTIGEGAVIGAGSVVLKDVPPWSIAAGAPARVLGPRTVDRAIGTQHEPQNLGDGPGVR